MVDNRLVIMVDNRLLTFIHLSNHLLLLIYCQPLNINKWPRKPWFRWEWSAISDLTQVTWNDMHVSLLILTANMGGQKQHNLLVQASCLFHFSWDVINMQWFDFPNSSDHFQNTLTPFSSEQSRAQPKWFLNLIIKHHWSWTSKPYWHQESINHGSNLNQLHCSTIFNHQLKMIISVW